MTHISSWDVNLKSTTHQQPTASSLNTTQRYTERIVPEMEVEFSVPSERTSSLPRKNSSPRTMSVSGVLFSFPNHRSST